MASRCFDSGLEPPYLIRYLDSFLTHSKLGKGVGYISLIFEVSSALLVLGTLNLYIQNSLFKAIFNFL